MKRFIVVLLLFLMACNLAPVKVEPLVFSVIPSDDPEVTHEYWDPVVEYLEEGLNREIKFTIVPDYTAQVVALEAGHVDFARLGSSSYVIAVREGVQITPIASAVKEKTGLPGYYGYIVVRKDSDLETLEDLNGHTFAFVDPQSSSGYVVPMCGLKKAGVTLGDVVFSGSHEASVLAVQNGTIDAGAIAQIRYDNAIAQGVLSADELRIIWQSDLIPNVPIVVQTSMAPELQERIQELFINMPTELASIMKTTGEVGYVAITDEHYDVIREIEAFVSEGK